MALNAKIGVLVMALLEDDYNKTGHMRPAATAAAQEIADALSAYGQVVHSGLVEEEEQAAAAARRFNAEDVDIIVAAELAYTKGVVPTRCFIDSTAPILVWNTQKIRRLGEDDDFDVIMLNSGMAGIPELTAALLRMGRDFEMVTSQFDDEDGRRRLHAVIEAAAVRGRLRRSRIALFGHPFEGMTDLMVDGLSLRRQIGPVVWPLEPEKVAVRFGELPQPEVDALVAAETARYQVEMEPGAFERSARLALALESVAREHSFDVVAGMDQIWLADPRVGIIPSYATGRLCEIGIPAAPEGDVSCGSAQLVLQELAGQSTTVENYVIDFDHEAVVFSHDGHGNPALADPARPVKVKHSIYYSGVQGFGAGFEFAYQPGPVTNLALVPTHGGGWRFVISEGEFLDYAPRPVSAPQTLFRHDTLPIADWCTAWCRAGAGHHMAAARGRWTPQLLALARMLGIEAAVV